MKQQSDIARDLTDPNWRKREAERHAEFLRWCEAMHQQSPEERIAQLERDLAAAQAERDALRERANALLHQIDIGDYVDSEGHALKNNIAVLTLMKALTNA